MSTAAIIVAAGRGTRAGGGLPKQWRDLKGHPVAWYAMRAFHNHPRIDRVVLVLNPDDMVAGHFPADPPADLVTGGATRQASVLAGLEALEGAVERVLIHDAARPGVSATIIDAVLDALEHGPAAAPALPVTDALWRGEDGKVVGTVAREGIYRAQTPQGFHLNAILAAHRAHDAPAADDVAVARAAGLPVTIVPGHEDNMKITGPEDFARAARIVED